MNKIYHLEVDSKKKDNRLKLPKEILFKPFLLGAEIKNNIIQMDFLITAQFEWDKEETGLIVLKKDEKVKKEKLGKLLGGKNGIYVFIENKK